MKVTKKNGEDFFYTCLGMGAIIGGNGLRYMQTTVSEELIGTQHFKYPTNWFNKIIEDKDTFEDIRISGAYHVGGDGNTFSRPFEYIIRDYEDYHKELSSHHGNLNGLSCDKQDELKKEFKNLSGMIFYYDLSKDIRNKILIVLNRYD